MLDTSYFRKLSTPALQASIKDISRALEVARTWQDNGRGEAKYSDQYGDAISELNRRTGANVCKCCKRPL